jgi:UDP-N-acetylmuramoylalanine--D-glutamate ligase
MSEYEHDKNAIALYQKAGDIYIDGRNILTANHHDHNKSCAKAACIAALGESSSDAIDLVMSSVSGLPMRQEIVGVFGNVTIINDSTSTTPIALQTALRSFCDKPVVLIMGGNAKNLPYTDLVTEIDKVSHIKKIFFMPGTFTEEIQSAIQGTLISDFEQLIKTAMQYSRDLNQPCYLLFSPGATSFAQFKNEFDRGTRFNLLTSDIIKQWTEKS